MDVDQPDSSTGNASAGNTGSESTTSSTFKQQHAGLSGSGGSISGRKRKVPNSVTPNACTNCKKARAKCDGSKPACKRCTQRHVQEECHYDVHAKTAKEQMIREIQRLQRQNEYLEEENDTLGVKNESIEAIITSLKRDSQGPEIIRRLKRGESHQAIAEWLGRPLTPNTQALSPGSELQLSRAIERYHRDLVDNQDPRYWTNVTNDPTLIEHLVALYLTWIHPAHMLFDEAHFMESFQACSDTYCSSTLVNAICAMSCHLLHGIWENEPDSQTGMESLGRQFLDEAKALLAAPEYTKMTVIQTYAVMFLAELGSGHGLVASSYLRLATESVVAKNKPEQSSESSEVATWGLLTLHTAWSGLIYQKPTAPISTHATVFQDIDTKKDDGPWRFYKEPGDTSESRRPSYLLSTANEHARLYRIIHETILVFCGSRGRVSARHMLLIYERFLEWKERLPAPLANVDGDDDALPHALFLHIQYHVALLQLFQPLLHLDQYYKASHDYLRGLIVKHARISLALLTQYRNAYTFRYQSPILLFCIVHVCDALVGYDNGSDNIEIVRFCLESLEAAKIGYPVAGPLQRMFRMALDNYNISIPDELERLCRPTSKYGPDQLLDVCARPTYQQPINQLLPNLDPGLAQDFMDEWQKLCEERPPQDRPVEFSGQERQNSMQINALLNG